MLEAFSQKEGPTFCQNGLENKINSYKDTWNSNFRWANNPEPKKKTTSLKEKFFGQQNGIYRDQELTFEEANFMSHFTPKKLEAPNIQNQERIAKEEMKLSKGIISEESTNYESTNKKDQKGKKKKKKNKNKGQMRFRDFHYDKEEIDKKSREEKERLFESFLVKKLEKEVSEKAVPFYTKEFLKEIEGSVQKFLDVADNRQAENYRQLLEKIRKKWELET